KCANDDDIVMTNVATKVRTPKNKNRFVIEPLDPAECQTLGVAMRGDPLEALFLLALSCGLRRGEVCGVRWQDLDLERGTLRLAGQTVRTPGRGSTLIFQPYTKSDTGLGMEIMLTPPAVAALLAHRDRQAFLKGNGAELWTEQGYGFTNEIGQPIEHVRVSRMFKLLL